MKLTTVFIIATFLQVTAASYAQKVTYTNKHASLEQIFKEIRKQTGYNVLVSSDALNGSPTREVNFNNTPLIQVLEQSLKGMDLTYEIDNKDILIKDKTLIEQEKKAVLLPPFIIQGKVTDENNNPLQGATVKIKGHDDIITTTSLSGEFILNITVGKSELKNLVLQITFVGYDLLEVKVNPKLINQSIILKQHTSMLDQVQVQGYGQISKRLNTGNIGTVKAADIAKQPVTNPLLALQGRIAGMLVTQNSGLPNSTVSIRIRGTNTLSQQSEPLYIIDGVPYAQNMLLNVGIEGSGQASSLSFINPATIQSIDVLKDADATAIYGSRGANGVILITTKKGQSGKTKFDFNTYTGISQFPAKLKLMNTDEFLTMRKEAFANDGIAPTLDNGAIDIASWDPKRNINWQDQLIGKSTITNDAQLSMSGGSDNTSYRIFGGYNRTIPPFPGSFNASKVSGGVSLSTSSDNKRFRAQIGINYLSDKSYLPSYNPVNNLTLAPNAPEPFDAEGNLNWKDFINNPFSGFKNWYRGNTKNLTTNGVLSYQISSAFNFKVTGGYNNSTVNGIDAQTIAAVINKPGVTNPTGRANFSFNNITSWIAEPQLSYNGFFAKGKWDILLGATLQENRNNGELISGFGYTNDGLLNSLAASTSISKMGGSAEESRFNSLYSRINYNYEDKYILNITGRRDGSSRFGPGKKFGNFGAAGAAWIFSKESLIANNLPFLSFGKLRASYGITGNEPSQNYRYLALNAYLNDSRPYQNSTGITPSNLLSPDFAWEQVKKAEAGLELGFFKDRLLTSVSYYNNRSSNQLINYTLPGTAGFYAVLINRDALIENSGWEVTLSSKNLSSSNFSWTTDFNIAISRNKLLKFPGLENSPYANSLTIGKPLSNFGYYKSAGVNPETGVYQFYTKDGALTDNPDYQNDNIVDISLDPKFFGGFQNTFTYRQFSLDVFFQFVKQKGMNYAYISSDPPGQSFQGFNNQPKEVLDRWQKKGDVATYQRYTATYGDASNAYFYQKQSDASIVDASYIRLKNVSLAYQLPKKTIAVLGLQNARFYLQAQNLFTITGYKGLDPEAQTYLPPLSVWTIGTQITF